MNIEQLERDVADRFRMVDASTQNLDNRIDRLELLVKTFVAKQYVAAEEIVMPRSFSNSIESMVAPTPSLPFTSWTA